MHFTFHEDIAVASCLEILQNSYNYLEIYYPGGVFFCNLVCIASLCLIPHFIAVFVRLKMCLVAQFGKWLARIIFSGQHFLCQHQTKKLLSGSALF